MNPLQFKKPRQVVFCIGNDAAQMLGAWLCWHRWCWEEQGRELDHAAWLRDQKVKVEGGCFVQVVGWDGVDPVAMVEIYLTYDPMRHKVTAFGDKAYVHPDYRRGGVFKALLDFLRAFMGFVDVKSWTVPVGAGDEATAAFLRECYEREGFRLSGLTMEQHAA